MYPRSGVAWYDLGGKSMSTVTATGASVPAGATITQTGGQSKLTFAWELPESGVAEILWAYGSGNLLDQHAGRGATRVDFVTGSAALSTSGSTINLALLHGALMLVGWAILLPTGILMSVLREHAALANGRWFALHQRFQWSGLIISLIGVGIAAVMVDGAHLKVPHAGLGLVVSVVAVSQPINAALRPHATEPGAKKTAARSAWEKLHKNGGRLALVGAWINLVLGALALDNITSKDASPSVLWVVAFMVALAVLAAVAVAKNTQQLRVDRAP